MKCSIAAFALLFLFTLSAAVAVLPLPGAAPARYDLRQAHPQCIPPIREAGQCNAAGLIEGLFDMSAASCIATGKAVDLSSTYVEACCTACGACSGGSMTSIFDWLKNNGSVNASCMPKGPVRSCPTKCVDGSQIKPVRAQFVPVKEAGEIQHAISTVGPVMAYIDGTQLETYTSGILQCKGVKPSLNHVVSIIGWGIDGGIPYWIASNSWGPDWGEDGYFRIERGVDACGIEIINFGVKLLA
jgi:hypothetical protein